MARRVLITGAEGLLGGWVLRHWPEDLEPVTVTRRQTDLTIPRNFLSAIESVQPDMLLHLAWAASGTADYRSSIDNAAWASASLAAAEHCLKHGIHFIGTGTGIDDVAPVDAYSRSKSELRTALMHEIDSGALTWLRPFYVFDLTAERPRLVADTQSALRKRLPVLLQSPHARHDFVHASDVGNAIVTCLSHDLRGPIDIGSGKLRSVSELVGACGASWQRQPGHDRAGQRGTAANLSESLMAHWVPTATENFFRA